MNVKPLAQLISTAFDPGQGTGPLAAAPATASRRRSKLWELPPRWHCALLGTCFPPDEIAAIARRGGLYEPDVSDYLLHTRVVSRCGSRSETAELVQRRLDAKFADCVRQFARARGNASVLALWQQASGDGRTAGALWAALSHPDIDVAGGDAIYGDIHMRSHESASRFTQLAARNAELERDQQRLADEAAALLLTLAETRRERDRKLNELQARLVEAERRPQMADQTERAVPASTGVIDGLRIRLAAAEARAERLRRQNGELHDRVGHMTAELAAERQRYSELGSTYDACIALANHLEAGERPAPAGGIDLPPLAGRNIVCVGGRTGMIDRYRRLVESSGARFIHHDGGQEESLYRIENIVAGADIVLCQAGYVSHSAYWRVKDACKRRGLPCIYLKATGVGSFAHGIHSAVREQCS